MRRSMQSCLGRGSAIHSSCVASFLSFGDDLLTFLPPDVQTASLHRAGRLTDNRRSLRSEGLHRARVLAGRGLQIPHPRRFRLLRNSNLARHLRRRTHEHYFRRRLARWRDALKLERGANATRPSDRHRARAGAQDWPRTRSILPRPGRRHDADQRRADAWRPRILSKGETFDARHRRRGVLRSRARDAVGRRWAFAWRDRDAGGSDGGQEVRSVRAVSLFGGVLGSRRAAGEAATVQRDVFLRRGESSVLSSLVRR